MQNRLRAGSLELYTGYKTKRKEGFASMRELVLGLLENQIVLAAIWIILTLVIYCSMTIWLYVFCVIRAFFAMRKKEK